MCDCMLHRFGRRVRATAGECIDMHDSSQPKSEKPDKMNVSCVS